MVLRQLDVHMQKSQFSRGYTPFTIINLKWMIGLNVKRRLVKLPKENIRKNLGELGFEFLDTTSIAWVIKKKKDKLEFTKI